MHSEATSISNSAATRAYIGLGSNLDDPPLQLRNAFQALAALPMTQLSAQSSVYRSAPLGGFDQPDYLNAVVALDTTLSAHDLLAALLSIEQRQGRVRGTQRWQARTLDLDLLLYGEQGIQDATLIVPHPGLRERAFVLYPLREIAPELVIPGLGALSTLIGNCPCGDLQRVDGDA